MKTTIKMSDGKSYTVDNTVIIEISDVYSLFYHGEITEDDMITRYERISAKYPDMRIREWLAAKAYAEYITHEANK